MTAEGVPAPPDASRLTAGEARALFRRGIVAPSAGWADGYTQANLLIVPADLAYDVLLFAQRNPKACPVLDVLDAGQVTGRLLPDGDIRTDAARYVVYCDGVPVERPTDLLEVWQEDLVTFIIGCSFTFESALRAGGIPIAHIDQGVNVPMFRTDRRCRPAGSLAGPLVVSMRPVSPDRIADAVRITSRYPAVHGAPVHVGDPAALGIADLGSPDFGDPVDLPRGTVPVFWACGVTPQAAVMESRPGLAIGHAPGHMLVTDARDSDYLVP
ncbi:putative hydro-lyase [Arthrobacter bussei]|uniref:Putative hydro-lyase FNH21_07295 n=1 Tax=Arthrobacter bussei TaxID=2594179 RepID=A0A7X1NPH0_9MICC|nr:putative hydro-lyase [Arthrobacter bussei]MPY10530.1 putative hydro-lyase [Arthrobacter bussei]